MIETEQLRHTIASLEEQRPVLGDKVVETTIRALREKLAALNESPAKRPSWQRTAQRKQVTILFANVTGFTGMAELLPDTNMLDIMNVLWQRLDSAITRQAGVIDKHIGDAVMGLFGVPVTQEDDPERAIRAALAMRAALSDFVSELRSQQAEDGTEPDDSHPLYGLQLRVGINTGPVLLGEVGTGDEYTVIGDAVNVASRLEKAAPPGAILISHDTYMLVRGAFNMERRGPLPIRGRSEPIEAYMVLGVRPRLFYATGRGVEGVETRMVGRDHELHQLQRTLNVAVKTGMGCVVTIMGEAGVGKSRLLHEFNNWIKSLSYPILVFKGRTYQRMSQLPYVLFRDLFATHFDIQDNDPAAIAEEKLVQGMAKVMASSVADVRQRAQVIGQLIGLDLVDRFQLPSAPVEVPQIRNQAFAYVADFFESATAGSPVTLILLEDMHWADEGSLELLERLVKVCQRAPLIIVCLSRPALFAREPSWYSALNGQPSPGTDTNVIIRLSALSETESRQLVVDILRKLPEIPADLSDLIVSRAEGNPFYVEELIKVLIDDGVIITGPEQWRLQRNQLTEVRVPPNITGVLQARLDRLSAPERVTLQRAAVIGRVFWDGAVIHMNETADEPLSAAETVMALQALEKREMIFLRQISVFAGTQTYVFKHAILRQATYESVLLRQRPVYHKQVADWLAEQSGERVAEYAGVIAGHYELAGEKAAAAELYETAAIRAQELYNLEAAVDYYCKALSLL
ncbi:MAG TPA: adenylate/guanylate cyclase domain-containing protein, partial [Anaerolineae bacterium]